MSGGALNPETSVLPLDVSISGAIMELQESGFQITQRVFGECGTPRVITKRSASAAPDHAQDQVDKREAKVDSSGGSLQQATTTVDHSMLRRRQGSAAASSTNK